MSEPNSIDPAAPDPPPETVPDEYIVVRGGIGPLPQAGTPFSGAAGRDKYDAAQGIPHGRMRSSTAAQIRKRGGSVIYRPEPTRAGDMNERHVEIIEGESGAFGDIENNPVPKEARMR